jgi:hypothetical protein
MTDDDKLLSKFGTGSPPPNEPLQLLCRDESGLYVLPLKCEWRHGNWIIVKTSKALQVNVVGWRPAGMARKR